MDTPNMPSVLSIFRQKSKSVYVLASVMAMVNSSLNSYMLIFINNAIVRSGTEAPARYDWLLFCGLTVLSLGGSILFQRYMIGFTTRILADFQLSFLERLRGARYEAFEKIGFEKIYTAMSDISVLTNIPGVIVNCLTSAVVLLCCLGYLLLKSWQGGLTVIFITAVLLVFYRSRDRVARQKLNLLRDAQNDHYQQLDDFLHGFKELKMSYTRSENLFKGIRENTALRQKLKVETSVANLINELVGGYSWYVVIGVVIFALPVLFQLPGAEVVSFIFIVFYIMRPVGTLLGLVPFYSTVKIALERLHVFEAEIQAQVQAEAPYVPAAPPVAVVPSFGEIRFEQVSYQYTGAEGGKSGFSLDPISLAFQPGETVFIVGENGSGKSTFVKLLTGLYQPTSGHIYYGDQQIAAATYPFYCQQIAAIFTNHYLFRKNYDAFDISRSNPQLRSYIDLLQLEHVFDPAGYSHADNYRLSQGQKKRLALIYALLENKNIVVLDEWAAEQDPAFRSYFYHSLLKQMQRLGKTVIAVTHDEEYYGCADRLIRFGGGKIVSDERFIHSHI